MNRNKPRAFSRRVREQIIFALFGAMMFCSKLIMEGLPNIHPLAMFVMLLTIVYRKKALIPIYIYVFLQGLWGGFSPWWIPYLYLWTILWGVTMLLPKKMKPETATAVYPLVGALFGLSFGTLYAPAQAIMMRLSFQQTLAWIAAGLSFDLIHAVGNAVMCSLVYPLSLLLRRLEAKTGPREKSEKL